MTPRRRLTILTLILIGDAVIMLAVVGLGWFSTSSIQQLRTLNQALYVHPFTVSNVAADLKASLFQLRNTMFQIVWVKNPHDHLDGLEQEARGYEQQINADLAVIKANFLGDMGRVQAFESTFQHWNALRAAILTANRHDPLDTAEHLLKTDGTEQFNALLPLVDYILTFANDKAQALVTQANRASHRMMSKVFHWVMALVALVAATLAVVLWRVRFLEQELDQQATTDVLTGMANRRAFMDVVSRELERAKRYQTAFALAVVDLDWFKTINDTYGHHVGDEVLKTFCTVCRNTLRVSDTLGRIGGEEFAVLFPNTALADAQEVLERVRVAVEQTEMAVAQRRGVRITASFGVTAFVSTPSELDRLFQQADVALYQAKDGGRNRVCALAS